MSLELLLLADQGDVTEVFILSQTVESLTDVLLVLVPIQPKVLHFVSVGEYLFSFLPLLHKQSRWNLQGSDMVRGILPVYPATNTYAAGYSKKPGQRIRKASPLLGRGEFFTCALLGLAPALRAPQPPAQGRTAPLLRNGPA